MTGSGCQSRPVGDIACPIYPRFADLLDWEFIELCYSAEELIELFLLWSVDSPSFGWLGSWNSCTNARAFSRKWHVVDMDFPVLELC
jgi:hypothetical protein